MEELKQDGSGQLAQPGPSWLPWVPVAADGSVPLGSMPSQEDLWMQGTSQTRCYTEGLVIMRWQGECVGTGSGATFTFARGDVVPTSSITKRHQHHSGVAGCRQASPPQGPWAGEQLCGGFPSSCPSLRTRQPP